MDIGNKLQTVADYFLFRAMTDGQKISNKKLQKLVYYAQAWSLALNGVPLFDDDIEAWVHGPAIRALWVKYRDYGYQPIDITIQEPILEAESKQVMSEVWRVYGKLDAEYLEMLTHNESPWLDARGSASEGEASSAVISHLSMSAFYKGLLSEAR